MQVKLTECFNIVGFHKDLCGDFGQCVVQLIISISSSTD